MSRLSVSIAMGTYNGASFLREQLDSIAAQYRQPDELVITDDTSSDATADIVQAFARSAAFPVRFERNAVRLGFNGNLSRATAACAGEVILFSDQDDVWLPQHVMRIVEVFEANSDVGVVSSNSAYVDVALKPTGVTLWSSERFGASDLRRNTAAGSQDSHFAAWAKHRAVASHGMGIRADLRQLLVPFGSRWVFDQWVALLAVACSRGEMIDEPLTLHRQHAMQSVGNKATSLVTHVQVTPRLSSDFFENEVRKWSELRDRLATAASTVPGRPVAAGALRTVDDRVAFLEWRRGIRQGGAARRVLSAAAGFLTGKYHRYGRGGLTFARDVLG
jgi:Glycosyl transferase family 2